MDARLLWAVYEPWSPDGSDGTNLACPRGANPDPFGTHGVAVPSEGGRLHRRDHLRRAGLRSCARASGIGGGATGRRRAARVGPGSALVLALVGDGGRQRVCRWRRQYGCQYAAGLDAWGARWPVYERAALLLRPRGLSRPPARGTGDRRGRRVPV